MFRDIYISHSQVNQICECLQCPVSTGPVLHDLDNTINSLADRIGYRGADKGKHVLPVFLEGLHKLPKWLRGFGAQRSSSLLGTSRRPGDTRTARIARIHPLTPMRDEYADCPIPSHGK